MGIAQSVDRDAHRAWSTRWMFGAPPPGQAAARLQMTVGFGVEAVLLEQHAPAAAVDFARHVWSLVHVVSPESWLLVDVEPS